MHGKTMPLVECTMYYIMCSRTKYESLDSKLLKSGSTKAQDWEVHKKDIRNCQAALQRPAEETRFRSQDSQHNAQSLL